MPQNISTPANCDGVVQKSSNEDIIADYELLDVSMQEDEIQSPLYESTTSVAVNPIYGEQHVIQQEIYSCYRMYV